MPLYNRRLSLLLSVITVPRAHIADTQTRFGPSRKMPPRPSRRINNLLPLLELIEKFPLIYTLSRGGERGPVINSRLAHSALCSARASPSKINQISRYSIIRVRAGEISTINFVRRVRAARKNPSRLHPNHRSPEKTTVPRGLLARTPRLRREGAGQVIARGSNLRNWRSARR